MIFSMHDRLDAGPALFVEESGQWMTYEELAAKVHSTALSFARPSKKLAFCFMPNSAAAVVAVLGLIDAGHAVALLDPTMPSAMSDSLVESYRPDFILGAEEAVLARVRAMGTMQQSQRVESELLAFEGRYQHQGEIDPALALLLSTSGSTGSPKFVRLSRTNITANATAIAQIMGLDRHDRVLAHLPLHYSFGFSVISSHLAAGASIVVTPRSLSTGPTWQLFREQGCTSLPGVPTHFDILKRLDIDRLNIPSLNCLMQAGGRMRPELIVHLAQKIASRDGRLFIMYGQTEAAPRMTTLPADEVLASPGSVGPALPGGRIEIRGVDGRELPGGTIGEVVYFGPNVMMGYALSRADLAHGSELSDGLHTGDLGYLDERGYLTITGRANRFAKIHGIRVSLDDVEKILSGLTVAAAIEAEENKILVVVLEPVTEKAHECLVEALRIPANSIAVRQVAEIPTNSNGKTDYSRLSELT